jgi:uncharacterized protein GlcG (DUF336 family)
MYIGKTAAALLATVLAAGSATAQQQQAQPAQPAQAAPNPLDAIPDTTPFNIPYGPPISAARAQAAIWAAAAEAAKRNWALNIAVVDPGGSLVAFLRMDGAQLASVNISQHKARVAVAYRRPTRIFEDAIQLRDYKYILSLDDMIAVRGGIPLAEDGKIVGAIGCSGGTGSQDELVCTAGAATINR